MYLSPSKTGSRHKVSVSGLRWLAEHFKHAKLDIAWSHYTFYRGATEVFLVISFLDREYGNLVVFNLY